MEPIIKDEDCLFIESSEPMTTMYFYLIDINKVEDGFNKISDVLAGDK
jgi:hypothetical protein